VKEYVRLQGTIETQSHILQERLGGLKISDKDMQNLIDWDQIQNDRLDVAYANGTLDSFALDRF